MKEHYFQAARHEPLEPGATVDSGGQQDQLTLEKIRQIHKQQVNGY